MIRRLFFFSLLFSVLGSFAQIPTNYYNTVSNKTGDSLRAILRDIVTSGSVKLPYTSSSFDVWQAYSVTDVRPGTSTIWDMYSDVPSGTPSYNYTVFSGQCGTAASEGDCYAREHQVPNSWWGGLDDATHPQYTDLHHLPPADQYVNNRKSAHPIGQISNPTWTSINGSKVGPCSWPGYTGTVFEPINEYKGDFARAYFYVATRYMDSLSAWVVRFPGNESQYVINSSGNNFKQWFIDMLVKWSIDDPVSQKEIDRNNAIYYNTPQHNRNPYIDHPEYICKIWSSAYCNAGPSIVSVSQNPLNPLSSNAVSVSASVSSTNTISSVTLQWGTDASTFPNSINMSLVSGNNYTSVSSIPAQATNTIIYYRIVARDNQSITTNSSVYNYKVIKDEASNYPTGFSCNTITSSSIKLVWTDATGSSLPDGYIIKGSSVSLASISDPVDGVAEANSTFVKNVTSGTQFVTFNGLAFSSSYYFKIYPYTNSGTTINYKTSSSASASTCTTSPASSIGCATDLFISEYVEGSSSNKYIELYNNTGLPIDLSNYRLMLFSNGSATASSDVLLTGSLANQSVIVYKNSSATIYSGTSLSNSACNFNGNDAIALFSVSKNTYVDIIGRIGEDPGTSWTSGSYSTLDKTLVRNPGIVSGVTTNPSSGFPTLSTEWVQYNMDTVSNLGSHNAYCASCATPNKQSSNITFSAVGTNSMTISWTKGNGTKRLVVVKEGSAVLGLPVDSTIYTGNAAFGSGQTIANGEYIVYNDTSNSVTVTNLTPGLVYYVSIFESNCSRPLYLIPAASSSKITYNIYNILLSENQYCVTPSKGMSATVDFSIAGVFSSNTFTVQLSDSVGSFSSPVTIGSLISNLDTASINCTIPAGKSSGTGYRIRVVSSNPIITSSSGEQFQITLSANPTAPTSVSSSRSGFCSIDSGTITLKSIGGLGNTLNWYSGSCGGIFLGTGDSLVIQSPVSSTTYYARWANTCTVSSCKYVSVTVNSGTFNSTTANACSSYTWSKNSVKYYQSGTYTYSYSNTNGCPSVDTLFLTLRGINAVTSISNCGSYTWSKNNVTYTQSGNYTYSYTNVNSCIVVDTLKLIINTATNIVSTVSACNSYLWSKNNVTYTQSGNYTYSYTNGNGCASVDTLKLTINTATNIASSVSACNSYLWSKNNVTYTQNGNYTYGYTNVNGCASVDTLKLTINAASNIASTVSDCNSYLWSKNSVTYTQSGNYTYSYTNGNGCASLDTLHLTIAPLPVAGVLSGTANVCIGAVSSYSSSGNAGGVWKSTNESVATINSVSGLLTSLSVGVTTIRYIVSSSYCGSDTASIEIHINNCNTVVNVKAFIQGFYEGDNLMRAGLLNSEIAGATSLQADSITIEIRSAVSGNLVENPVMTILNTDGTATAVFPHLEGTKYIVLKHRNSIEIWSASPVNMGSVVNYDFSTAATQAYGDNMVDVGGGVFAMWSGDLNQDGAIESADYTMIENDILSILFGYYVSDLTGDGVVESADYTLMENNVLKIIFAAKPF